MLKINKYHKYLPIYPLDAIVWGMLIYSVDITIYGFDILNDFVGMLIITWGVFKLSEIPVHERYRKAMVFIKITAILGCLAAFHNNFQYQIPQPIIVLLSIIEVATLCATFVFCITMRWLCIETDLERSAKSWKITTILFSIFFLLPTGLFYVLTALVPRIGPGIELGLESMNPLFVPLLLLVSLSPILFFVSIFVMKKEVKVNTFVV